MVWLMVGTLTKVGRKPDDGAANSYPLRQKPQDQDVEHGQVLMATCISVELHAKRNQKLPLPGVVLRLAPK